MDSGGHAEASQIDNNTVCLLAGIRETDSLAINNAAVDWGITAWDADIFKFEGVAFSSLATFTECPVGRNCP